MSVWLNQFVRILGIGYDPWKSQEVINMLAASGAGNVIKGIRQTYGTFTTPIGYGSCAVFLLFVGRLDVYFGSHEVEDVNGRFNQSHDFVHGLVGHR